MYLDKARSLTKGLRKHLVTVKNYGVSASDLSKLEAAILEGEKLNAEVDRRRAELNEIIPNYMKARLIKFPFIHQCTPTIARILTNFHHIK